MVTQHFKNRFQHLAAIQAARTAKAPAKPAPEPPAPPAPEEQMVMMVAGPPPAPVNWVNVANGWSPTARTMSTAVMSSGDIAKALKSLHREQEKVFLGKSMTGVWFDESTRIDVETWTREYMTDPFDRVAAVRKPARVFEDAQLCNDFNTW
jgi:hypothetical protein